MFPMRKRPAVVLGLLLFFLVGGGAVYLFFLAEKAVYGRVLDSGSGLPISGAEVTVAGAVLKTDEGGDYRLEKAPAQAQLSAQAPGYQPRAVSFSMPTLSREMAVDISLQPNLLSGVVKDAWNGEPVARALIRTNGREAGSDMSGLYSLNKVVPPLTLEVTAPGYLPWQGKIEELSQLNGGTPFDLSLVPNTVTGTVWAIGGEKPLSGTEVILGSQVAKTGPDGSFALNRLSEGAAVTFRGPDEYRESSVTYKESSPFEVTLEPRAATVTIQDGFTHRPVVSATLFLEDKSPFVSDENGRAVVSPIRPGEKIRVEAQGFLPAEVGYRGDEEALSLIMQPYELQGVVRDARTMQPLPGAKIYADGRVIRADSEGNYRLDKIPNAPVLTVKIGGYRKATLNVHTTVVTPTASGSVAPCASQPKNPGPLCLDIALAPADIRGVYIPYGLLSKPDTIKQLIDMIDGNELNAFVVDVKSDNGYLPYASSVPLAVQLGVGGERKDWMKLKDLLELARQKNIYAVARIVTFKDNPLAHGRPDLAVKRVDGSIWIDREGLAWVNPMYEEVWDYDIAIAKEIAELGFDEIQFDYIRFPSDGDVGAIAYPDDISTETRVGYITGFLQRMSEALEPYGVFTSLDLFGLTVWVQPGTDMNIGQRVEDMAPYVDYICPMVYPQTFGAGNLGYQNPMDYPYEVVFRSQKAAMRRVPAWTNVRPWLQAYWYDLSQMQLQKQAAIDGGSIGWTYWNAGGKYDLALFNEN